MAFCPNCKGEMQAKDILCPHCGYDFPSPATDSVSRRTGLAYSTLADIALIVSNLCCALGSLAAIFASLVFLYHQEYFNALVYAPFCFFVQFGLWVVFTRIQDA